MLLAHWQAMAGLLAKARALRAMRSARARMRATTPVPRQRRPCVVTTGRKKTPSRITAGIEDSYVTGERITLQAAGRGTKLIRHVDPSEQAQPAAAFVDALAFTVVPPNEQSWPWVLQQMQQFLPIAGMEKRNGIYGFK